uniref:Uncharacterized protein n=1 Tax=Tanacetum cinerariifolium TaxID=118510 RepID=A0A6L2JEA3_TANCI|nr:hypothetical protein [Tanacetum cinerariifolium]
MVIQNQSRMGEGSAMPTDPHHTPTILQPSLSQPQKTHKPMKPKRKDTQVPQPSDPTKSVTDEAVYKELGNSLVRIAITASSLEVEQDSESSGKEESFGEDASKQERRIDAIDADKDITMVSVQDDAEMFDVNDVLDGEEGKAIMVEEPVKPKKKEQIWLDEEAAKRLQEQFNKEERLPKERAQKEKEANIALIEEWDDVQAKIHVDYQLAERLQAEEQEELSDAKKATLFVQLLEEKESILQVNTFDDFRIELVEGKEKRAGTREFKEVEDDKETTEIKQLIKIIPKEEEVANDAISQMLKSFSKEDLEDLYKLVKARYGSTRPVENMDYLLWSDMKTMFEPHVEDEVWKRQQGYKVLEWKQYDSCGVHSLMM